MSVQESTASQSFSHTITEFLDHKGTWITAFVISVLAIVTASLIIAQQYGGVGHGFSLLDKVPLGATCTIFGVGGILFSYSTIKIVKDICLNLEDKKKLFKISDIKTSQIHGQAGSLCTWGYSAIDQTYEGSRENNCDFAYTNPDLGLVLVVDGAGHNNTKMHQALKVHLEENLLPTVAESLDIFSSIEEAKDWLREQIENFAINLALDQTIISEKPTSVDGKPTMFQMTLRDTSARPAMSLGFIVTVGDEKHFVHYQTGDTTFTIKRGGNLIYLPSFGRQNGVMSQQELSTQSAKKLAKKSDYLDPYISSIQLEAGDMIVGCSDGITEFLTQDQFKKWFEEEPSNMLPKAKKIIQEDKTVDLENTPSAQHLFWPKANLTTKPFSAKHEDKNYNDDISVAILQVIAE